MTEFRMEFTPTEPADFKRWLEEHPGTVFRVESQISLFGTKFVLVAQIPTELSIAQIIHEIVAQIAKRRGGSQAIAVTELANRTGCQASDIRSGWMTGVLVPYTSVYVDLLQIALEEQMDKIIVDRLQELANQPQMPSR